MARSTPAVRHFHEQNGPASHGSVTSSMIYPAGMVLWHSTQAHALVVAMMSLRIIIPPTDGLLVDCAGARRRMSSSNAREAPW